MAECAMAGRRFVAIPFTVFVVAVAAICGSAATRRALAQTGSQAASREIVQADTEFARAVAERNRERFLSFIADVTTFNGGSANELRGRDAVMKDWDDFFDPNGPTLTWTPTKGEVIGAGDVGYTAGRSLFRARAVDGSLTERRGEYLTVWRRQRDGSWKVVFDTGSTLPGSQ
jgi:ketosteroid isomerase-like protein